MVNSLSRLGLPQNSPNENRRLAIDLAGLVVSWEKRRQAEAKGPADGENQNPGGAAAEPALSSGAGDAAVAGKRPTEAGGPSGPPEDLSKKVKMESGLPSLATMSPSIVTSSAGQIPNIGTPGSIGQPDEEFKPNAAMEEMIINFVIRVRCQLPKLKPSTPKLYLRDISSNNRKTALTNKEFAFHGDE